MTAWIVAVAAGFLLAALTYAGRAGQRRAPLGVLAAALRWLAATLIVALLLDAPAGRARPPRPLVALDVSASWLRGGDSGWSAARLEAARVASEPLLLVGDSARPGDPPATPGDLASAARPAVERALAAGRPLVLFTDGELDDAEVLDRLPGGSELRVTPSPAIADLAAVSLDAPAAAVGGDTLTLRARVGAGGAGAGAAALRLLLDDDTLATARLDSLAPFTEQTVELRAVLPRREGTSLLRLIASAAGDAEPHNDTLTVAIELSAVAGVTVVSTAPDFDLRYMLEVLRGTVSLPSRAYVQVAPGRWRLEGSLAPVEVETVRAAARRAPILVLHGDTTVFGIPASVGAGALLLVPAPATSDANWYAAGAPASPLTALLSGVPWDSLPPLAVGSRPPAGEWTGLVVQRARQFERMPAITGSEQPRRRVVVGAAGLWRWRFRGGAASDAFSSVWGGIFDWLAAERRDARAAVPEHEPLRAGEPVRWRRGGADSVVSVTLSRRGSVDSTVLTLRFPAGASVVTTPPLPAGIYDARVRGVGTAGAGSPGADAATGATGAGAGEAGAGTDGHAVLAVSASRELLPRRPSVATGPVGSAPRATGIAPPLRALAWAYVLVVLLLCAEWLVRRRAGMR